MQPKNRQLRMSLTGGGPDIAELAAVIKAHMSRDGLQGQEWSMTWEEEKGFGEVGPIRKYTLGFTSK